MTRLPDTLAAAATALRAGEVTAAGLLEAAGDHDRELNAYVEFGGAGSQRLAACADAAFAAGIDSGVLQGIPVSVKDIYGAAGWATRAGSPGALPAPWADDGPLVAGLRRRIAVFTGKTHCVEFAFGGIGINCHWPAPRNPWDPGRVCGGSSSGAGVSLADGSCLVALGTDTAGSVRIPASMTGHVGVKTTAGRWPTGGIVPLSHTLDTAGILTRTVEDAWLAFKTIDDPQYTRGVVPAGPASLVGTTVGVARCELWDGCSPGIVEAVQQALRELEKAGARLVEVDFAEAADALDLFRTGNLPATELSAFLAAELPACIGGLDPNVHARVAAAQAIGAAAYLGHLRRLRELARRSATRLSEFDALATPCVAITPPRFDEVASPESYPKANLLALRNTSVVNYLGLCAVTLPAGLDAAGMPVGLQLIGGPMQDEALLRFALAAERRIGKPDERLGRPPRPGRGLMRGY